MIRRLSAWTIIALLIVIGIGLYLLLSPLFLLLIPIGIFGYFEHRSFIKKYNQYLQTIDGTKFFCYNNRANSKSFIETKILPELNKEIKLIYLDGKTPKSKYEQKFISHALYSIQDKKGFPYLLKVSGGQLSDKSINNDFYNTMNQGKDISQLTSKINSFFQNSLTHHK